MQDTSTRNVEYISKRSNTAIDVIPFGKYCDNADPVLTIVLPLRKSAIMCARWRPENRPCQRLAAKSTREAPSYSGREYDAENDEDSAHDACRRNSVLG